VMMRTEINGWARIKKSSTLHDILYFEHHSDNVSRTEKMLSFTEPHVGSLTGR
jgi:hypothetical protein